MSSAYVCSLGLHQQSAPAGASKPTLQDRFVAWYQALPEISKRRPFSMAEFEHALGTQGKYLGPILIRLGWERHRRWASTGEYNRYWTPPPGH